jgi:hypothetical protein
MAWRRGEGLQSLGEGGQNVENGGEGAAGSFSDIVMSWRQDSESPAEPTAPQAQGSPQDGMWQNPWAPTASSKADASSAQTPQQLLNEADEHEAFQRAVEDWRAGATPRAEAAQLQEQMEDAGSSTEVTFPSDRALAMAAELSLKMDQEHLARTQELEENKRHMQRVAELRAPQESVQEGKREGSQSDEDDDDDDEEEKMDEVEYNNLLKEISAPLVTPRLEVSLVESRLGYTPRQDCGEEEEKASCYIVEEGSDTD